MNIEAITKRAINRHGCTRNEALYLASDACKLDDLMNSANQVREAHFGRLIQFCVITNARSGACSQDCRFCAQSAHHLTGVDIYPLRTPQSIVKDAAAMNDSGADTFGIVTSGPSLNDDELAGIIQAVRTVSQKTRLEPCASLGKLPAEQFRALKQAGLKRFHHNLETSREFYPRICTTQSWEERYQNIKVARSVGLEVCSGGLFGLGESWKDRIDLGMSLRELEVQSVPVNFLNPVAGTPMQSMQPMNAEEALRIIALFRLILPMAIIRVCGGRPVVLGARQPEMFRAGANALMTGDYLTTSGISPETDRRMVEHAGLAVSGMRDMDKE